MRALQQVARQLQPAGDLQGVAHAVLADVQAIGRPQRLHVELDGAVLGPLVVEGIRFQIAQMRRHHRPAAAFVEAVEDGPAQRRPFRRVGAGAEFVQQNQAIGVGFFEDEGDARDVRTEGAERLFQALFVADVGQDVVEDGDVAALAGRDVHAGLGHEAEQAGRLEADRFAAGVRPGDDEQVEAGAEANVDGHDFSRSGVEGRSRRLRIRRWYAFFAPLGRCCISSGCRACRSQSRPSVLTSGAYME